MPEVALILCVAWFVSLFVLRSVVHWWNTGSTGIKGFDGKFGSLPWLAGVAASLGLVLAPLAPVAAMLEWQGGALLAMSPSTHIAGALVAALGVVGAGFAQLSMGNSWRVGVDETEKTELVTQGLYTWVRNPIFTFITVSIVGYALLVPNLFSLLAAVLTIVGIELQVRAVEEPYLLRVHPEAYGAYAANVGRFVPWLGKLVGG